MVRMAIAEEKRETKKGEGEGGLIDSEREKQYYHRQNIAITERKEPGNH